MTEYSYYNNTINVLSKKVFFDIFPIFLIFLLFILSDFSISYLTLC